MTDHPTEFDGLLADIHTYLAQRRRSGQEWYLDPGPPVGPGPLPEAVSQADPGALVNAAAELPPQAVSGAAAKPEPEDSFAADCRRFVERTLAAIQSSRRTVAPQGDIFAPEVESPRTMSAEEKAAALAELAAEVSPCRLCGLHAGRTQTVFGVGDPNADLVFIGEAPGRDEDLQGEPFVGRAGRLLTEILKAISFRRAEVYICNILKCRPPQNRDPERIEVDACEPYLKRQLEIIEPKLICCLGRVAAQNLLGTRAALGALRESVHFYTGIPVIVTFHPAALLRNPHWKRPTWDDVRRLRALHDALRG
jgi:uracil-DNA glycosylase family 4